MEKPNAVIEITNNVIRLVVGYIVNDKPAIIFTHEVDNHDVIRNGEIVDFNGLVEILSQMKVISDNESHVRITLKEVTLLLPSIGFSVYRNEKSTGVVSQSSKVQQIDIQNAINLVQKDPVPNGQSTIDIIPIKFLLDGGRTSQVPPINETSSSLTVSAFIHTLPKHIVESYLEAFEKVDIMVKRCFVSVYALSELARNKGNFPQNYILVDMGHQITSLTIIGNNYPYNSTHFSFGGYNLAKLISENLNISVPSAYEYMTKYGVDSSTHNFNPKIGESLPDDAGQVSSFSNKDLTKLMKIFFADYKQRLDAALNALTEGYSEEVKKLPLVFTGGLSSLPGMKEYIKENFEVEIHYLAPSSVGVRHPRFSASIGALLLASRYRGSLSDQKAKVAEVKREE